ncbi:GH14675 [Drosophila grimshawi]|uniref:GH14675 n=1 Tax=Drosophila grimshawi TaxID=7222 RepID=B4IXM1_DROGR|nr:GH14675 [Drosophila grimshawi]
MLIYLVFNIPLTVKLLLLYGFLFALNQCVFARTYVSIVSESESIEAPNSNGESEEDDPKYELVVNDINLCANVANNTLLPDITNCSSYINCIDGKYASTGSCYEGTAFDTLCKNNTGNCELLFDYKYQTCNYATDENVKCLPMCEEYNLTSFCYDRTCTKYVLCYFGIPVLRECHDGLQYNAETDRCDFSQYVDCVENECSAEKDVTNIVYLPSKAGCSKYFICSDGTPWPQTCTSGLVFDITCNCCVPAGNVECQMTPQQRNIQPYSRSPPRRADIICPAHGVHFYAHKSRVDAYYYCVDGNGVTLDCTPGLWYDSKLRECRQPKYIANN